ncbi:MAG: MarR family winged helix-turn-helix transcriptional regulator [Caulobacterales bacterium]|uniref:MarR family winged helix-turn-helix transcriptional regulator n=1 Tax=Glycocaulis sp. TaxID=1969725 RepID=UPI003F9FDC57
MARARAVDRRLYLLMEITARRLHRQADARLRAEAGVTAAQSAVLFLLMRRGERRMGSISDTLALGAPAVTGLVSRMESIGLVSRGPDSQDKRSAIVTLTEAGRELAIKADQTLRDINLELAERLGEDDAEMLHALLSRLNMDEAE